MEDESQPQIREALRGAHTGFRRLIRSEIHLASAEISASASELTRRSSRIVVFSLVLGWAILPLTFFLIAGLAALLDGTYWLSSLIWAVVAVAVGGAGLYLSVRAARVDGLTLPRTRRAISREVRRAA
jgi:hypothetical protein